MRKIRLDEFWFWDHPGMSKKKKEALFNEHGEDAFSMLPMISDEDLHEWAKDQPTKEGEDWIVCPRCRRKITEDKECPFTSCISNKCKCDHCGLMHTRSLWLEEYSHHALNEYPASDWPKKFRNLLRQKRFSQVDENYEQCPDCDEIVHSSDKRCKGCGLEQPWLTAGIRPLAQAAVAQMAGQRCLKCGQAFSDITGRPLCSC